MPRGKKTTGRKGASTSRVVADRARAETYRHPTAQNLLRPEVGVQAQFRKKKPPVTYRYDSSLSPALDWDGQNGARELAEWLLAMVEKTAALPAPHDFDKPQEFKGNDGKVLASVGGMHDAIEQLKCLGKPFLNWAGKAERLSFDVPTLPLFVHERLSTKAIIETLTGHKKDKQLALNLDLFGDPQHSITDQVLKAYEHKDPWVNRLILGDSLVVMSSLLHYEGLGGQVQMIYMDPPYGVEFGSNFQPFVRKRDVSHNDDEDMTREPEMVKAYRDTWELGLHSYLAYLRDRLLLARELLTPNGSVFLQISDDNLHHVREVMDEVFGSENFVVTIFVRKKGSQRGNDIRPINDYLLWYCKDKARAKTRFLYDSKLDATDLADEFEYVEMSDGANRRTSTFTAEELDEILKQGARLYVAEPLTSGGEFRTQLYSVEHEGRTFRPPPNNSWKFNKDGMNRIVTTGRIHIGKNQIRFKKYHTDFPFRALTNLWSDLAGATDKIYVVQTTMKVIQRCILMTTDPGDLVLDPTCGGGTTGYVAERWGRRWINIDVSRVPLALARQRLLTATFPYFELCDSQLGPVGGFVYRSKQSKKGEQVGGIVPHVTSTTIANDERPVEEVLVDRPEVISNVIRVSGPFCVEATIPTPVDWESDGAPDTSTADAMDYSSFLDRMLEVLRRSPVLHVGGGKKVEFKNIRRPAKTLSLSAEAIVANGADKAIAIIFGPENGAISEKLVYEAAREAHAKNYTHLYVIGFAIQPGARTFIEHAEAVAGIAGTYVQATPDILMGDLLKNMRSSQIFSVCGLPEVKLHKVKGKSSDPDKYTVELVGLDVFDPATMETEHRSGDDVPAWLLDGDYNGLCFKVTQAFFPRTSAWESLKRALKATHEESVWDHLAGTVSAPFEAGDHGQIAVKVIDDRGNELLVIKNLKEAR
jgi:adenine-specific DNA-methyltransferase